MDPMQPDTAATVAQGYAVILLVVVLEARGLRHRGSLTPLQRAGVIVGAIARGLAVIGTAVAIGAAMWSVINEAPLPPGWVWLMVIFGVWIAGVALLIMVEFMISDVRRRFKDAAKTAKKEAAARELASSREHVVRVPSRLSE